VLQGYATSLARPGGNVTGAFLDMPGLAKKWLELLTRSIPQLERVALLWDPTTGPIQLEAVKAVADQLELQLHTLTIHSPSEFETAFVAATQAHADALILLGSPLVSRTSKRLADLAAASRLPSVSPFRTFAKAGDLMSYGPSLANMFQSCGGQVGKILSGTSPSEMSIERPYKFGFVVNLKAAEALGLTIPPTLLFQANEVIR